jgi:cytochrome c peroxidase
LASRFFQLSSSAPMRLTAALVVLWPLVFNPPPAASQNIPSSTPNNTPATPPPNAPTFLEPTLTAALSCPLPGVVYATGGVPNSVPQKEYDSDQTGQMLTYQPGGATNTHTNAFFQSLGSNGRACITCHQPPSGFSVSLANIQTRFVASGGVLRVLTYGLLGTPTDPIFAPVDGATCPSNVPKNSTALSLLNGHLGGTMLLSNPYSLILSKGLFRIFLPIPKETPTGAPTEYTLTVLRDPYGCNTDPNYNSVRNPDGSISQIVSVYRRPRISTNLKFVTTVSEQLGFPTDPLTGKRQPIDPFTSQPESGNIMWDGREPTLQSQATDATMVHAQAATPPTADQVAQMVNFENGVYNAQDIDNLAGPLDGSDGSGAMGGPVALASFEAGTLDIGGPVFDLYDSWSSPQGLNLLQDAQRASIYRGEEIFNTRQFTISNVNGFNDIPAIGNNVSGTCSSCHNQVNAGSDGFPDAQQHLGTDGQNAALPPSPDLPLFSLTCTSGPLKGNSYVVTDPGTALITGQCTDIGKFTVAQLRALAAHPPYFHNGAESSLMDVINFYNSRFNIGLSSQDEQDLVNFLSAL